MRRFLAFAIPLLAVSFALHCSDKGSDPELLTRETSPRIDSLNANAAWPGDTLMIFGIKFGSEQDSSYVSIDDAAISVYVVWSDTLISTVVPLEASTGKVEVIVGDRISNAVSLTVYDESHSSPQIEGLSADTVWQGVSIGVFGEDFGSWTPSSAVYIGSVACQDYHEWEDTLIRPVVPQGATTGQVVVATGNLRSNAINLVVHGVDYIEPSYGRSGEQVSIHGSGFESIAERVYFGDTEATVLAWSDSVVHVIVPAHLQEGLAQVTIGNHEGGTFQVLDDTPPHIQRVSPDFAIRGDTVQINGSDFGAVQGISNLRIGDHGKLVDTILEWTDSTITFIVPDWCVGGEMYVETDTLRSNRVDLTVFLLSKFNPSLGTPGDVINLLGQGFGTHQNQSYVTIGSRIAESLSWSPSRVSVSVPQNAESGDVSIVVRGKKQSLPGFKVVTPFEITEVYPDSGYYRDEITIKGTGFGDVPVSNGVTFAHRYVDRLAGRIHYWSDTMLVAEVPLNAVSGEIIVKMADVSASGGFFKVFGIESVSLLWGPPGYRVTIEGAGFGDTQGNNQVLFEGIPGEIVSWSYDEIVTKLPHEPTEGTMTFVFNGHEILAKTYRVFSIDEVTPERVIWGDEVKVTGRNLDIRSFGDFRDGLKHLSVGGVRTIDFVLTDTLVTGHVPVGAKSGTVFLSNVSRSTNHLPIDVFQVEYVFPAWGVVGDTVEVIGTGFGEFVPSSEVVVGGTTAEVNYWSDTLVGIIVPSGATCDSVYVRTGGLRSNSVRFDLQDFPEIYELLASTNRIHVSFKGLMEFSYRTICSDITFERKDPPWYIDTTSNLMTFVGPGLPLGGTISADGTTLASMYCYKYLEWTWIAPGPDEIEVEVYTLKLSDIQLHSVDWNEAEVVFQIEGPDVEFHTSEIEMYEDWPNGGGGGWQYIDTYWDDTDCPPSITVTFSRE